MILETSFPPTSKGERNQRGPKSTSEELSWMERTCTSCLPRLKIHLASNTGLTVPGLCTAGKGGEEGAWCAGYKADTWGRTRGELGLHLPVGAWCGLEPSAPSRCNEPLRSLSFPTVRHDLGGSEPVGWGGFGWIIPDPFISPAAPACSRSQLFKAAIIPRLGLVLHLITAEQIPSFIYRGRRKKREGGKPRAADPGIIRSWMAGGDP